MHSSKYFSERRPSSAEKVCRGWIHVLWNYGDLFRPTDVSRPTNPIGAPCRGSRFTGNLSLNFVEHKFVGSEMCSNTITFYCYSLSTNPMFVQEHLAWSPRKSRDHNVSEHGVHLLAQMFSELIPLIASVSNMPSLSSFLGQVGTPGVINHQFFILFIYFF